MNQINFQKKMDEILACEDTRAKSLLLQCCCAPCSSHCLTVLEDKISITAYYYNPNITDRTEHDKRAEELKRLVGILNSEFPDADIEYAEGPFEPEKFYDAARGLEQEPERGARCAKCFELRLRETARKAKAEARIYEDQYQDARELINLQVSQARTQYAEALKRVDATLGNLDSAEENLRMASRGLEAGVVEPNTALAAHTGWLKAHSEYIDAGVELQLAASNLMKAEGNYKSDLSEKK